MGTAMNRPDQVVVAHLELGGSGDVTSNFGVEDQLLQEQQQ